MKKLLAIILAVILMLGLCACADNNEDKKQDEKENTIVIAKKLRGKWYGPNGSPLLNIKSDGTGSVTYEEEKYKATFSAEDDIFTADSKGYSLEGEYTLEDDILTVISTDNDKNTVTIFSRNPITTPEGVWIMEDTEDSGIFFDFGAADKDGKGDAYIKGGGMSYFGTYELGSYNIDKDTDIPDFVTEIAQKESLSGEISTLTSDFYLLGMNGGKFILTRETADNKDTLTLKYLNVNGAVADVKYVESRLPEYEIDPQVITNSSADEAGINTLVIDDRILGQWEASDYGTYTFNADGTGSYRAEYKIDPIYEAYDIRLGYGLEMYFKYTTNNGIIYFTVDYYASEPQDGTMDYSLDGDTLVIDSLGYQKVK